MARAPKGTEALNLAALNTGFEVADKQNSAG
jgi:hypothetical protein